MADPVRGVGGEPIGQNNLAIRGKVGRMTMFKLNKDLLLRHGRVLDPDELPFQVRAVLRTSAAV